MKQMRHDAFMASVQPSGDLLSSLFLGKKKEREREREREREEGKERECVEMFFLAY